jgi:hypothetical protein
LPGLLPVVRPVFFSGTVTMPAVDSFSVTLFIK